MIYTYQNTNIELPQLQTEIQSSSIVTALDSLIIENNELKIAFKAPLSVEDETLLGVLVVNHIPVPPIESAQLVEITEQPPFAKPDYRTKRDSNSTWVTCPANQVTSIDFQLTEERYASGGEIIFKNAKEGDWISAEVYDKDGVIPDFPYGDTGLTYRQALAEAWPSVVKYIVKKWLMPTELDKYGSFMIDTYPLNARITAGLYLRITYNASAEAGDRKCAVNYHLTQKL